MTSDDNTRPDGIPQYYGDDSRRRAGYAPDWHYGADRPRPWCEDLGRPVERWSWTRDEPIRYDFEIGPPVCGHASAPDSHLWIDAAVWDRYIAQPTRRQRMRRWTRRRLWFATRDGRQNRELRRLIARYSAERGQ